MPIRFDDSLPALSLVIMEQLGPDMLERGVVLRDASGRLAFFAPDPLDSTTKERVAQRLRDALGSYARFDRVVANCNDFGASTVLCDATALPVLIGASRTRLLDRRMVGADWLRAPAPMSAQPRRFVFASLKGGVGRSTGLAVAAVALASRGLRVLAIDLDMEAPGLGPMLLDPGTLPEFGVLDALVENGLSGLDNAFLADLVGPSALAGGRGRIDVIPVLGRRSLENPADVLAKIAPISKISVRMVPWQRCAIRSRHYSIGSRMRPATTRSWWMPALACTRPPRPPCWDWAPKCYCSDWTNLRLFRDSGSCSPISPASEIRLNRRPNGSPASISFRARPPPRLTCAKPSLNAAGTSP